MVQMNEMGELFEDHVLNRSYLSLKTCMLKPNAV